MSTAGSGLDPRRLVDCCPYPFRCPVSSAFSTQFRQAACQSCFRALAPEAARQWSRNFDSSRSILPGCQSATAAPDSPVSATGSQSSGQRLACAAMARGGVCGGRVSLGVWGSLREGGERGTEFGVSALSRAVTCCPVTSRDLALRSRSFCRRSARIARSASALPNSIATSATSPAGVPASISLAIRAALNQTSPSANRRHAFLPAC